MAPQSDKGWRLDLGANLLEASRVRFRVWAPRAKSVSVRLLDPGHHPIPMDPPVSGYFEVTIEGARAGDHYINMLDGEKVRPDPDSRSQPGGVHQASAVVDPDAFGWTDQEWKGVPFNDLIIYELHAGTFTAAERSRRSFPTLTISNRRWG